MIKAVIFDIGGVLIRTKDLAPRRKWEQQFGLQDWQLQDLFFNSEIGQRAQTGHASVEDAWGHVQAELNLTQAQLRELRADFFAGDRLDPEVLSVVHSLKPNYTLGIISNAMPDGRQFANSFFDLSLFDVVVFSAEEGVKKPGHEIYQRALSRLNVSPNESVFIDDAPANIKTAGELGINTVLFTPDKSARDLQAALAALNVIALD